MRTFACPTYPEIRLTLFQARKISRELDAFDPDCVQAFLAVVAGWTAADVVEVLDAFSQLAGFFMKEGLPIFALIPVPSLLECAIALLSIVGLPETEVKESKDRVRSAILNSRFEFPTRRITINLAPADLPFPCWRLSRRPLPARPASSRISGVITSIWSSYQKKTISLKNSWPALRR